MGASLNAEINPPTTIFFIVGDEAEMLGGKMKKGVSHFL